MEFEDVPIKSILPDADLIAAENLLRSRMGEVINLTAAEMLHGYDPRKTITYSAPSAECAATLTIEEIQEAFARIPKPEPMPPMVVKREDFDAVFPEEPETLWGLPFAVIEHELIPDGCIVVLGRKEMTELSKRARGMGLGVEELVLGHMMAEKWREGWREEYGFE